MEIMSGLTSLQKPAITQFFTLHMAIIFIADTIFLTNLQKRENRRNDPPLDNTKMQAG